VNAGGCGAPSLLLFDLGGVLLENATFDRLNRLLPAPMETAALKDRWLASPAVRRFELGETAPGEFAETFLAEWRIQLTPHEFLEEFVSWPQGLHPEALAALPVLRRRYRVACLSNCNVLHWQRFGGFGGHFDLALSSHQLGAIKPDDEAFLRALGACQAEPSSVWFFDDSIRNVHAAARLGIRAFHVDGISPLLHVLRAERLLP